MSENPPTYITRRVLTLERESARVWIQTPCRDMNLLRRLYDVTPVEAVAIARAAKLDVEMREGIKGRVFLEIV